MMNLRPHRRVHIPNTLAIFAVVLLLISSVTGYGVNQKANDSTEQTTHSVNADNTENASISNSASIKSRRLNLGLLLFRRG